MPGHFSDRELRIVTSAAPVAVQYPQAVGSALAFKMRGEDGVVLVCGGEASTSQGDWHEAMNFAGVHDLPVIFIVQNNRSEEHTSELQSRQYLVCRLMLEKN